jgi:hypothetical protein
MARSQLSDAVECDVGEPVTEPTIRCSFYNRTIKAMYCTVPRILLDENLTAYPALLCLYHSLLCNTNYPAPAHRTD